MLIDAGADVDAADDNKVSPLHLAASSGELALIKIFIEHTLNINQQTLLGATPLLCAIISGHYTAIKLFIDKGADTQLADKEGKSPWIATFTSKKLTDAQKKEILDVINKT